MKLILVISLFITAPAAEISIYSVLETVSIDNVVDLIGVEGTTTSTCVGVMYADNYTDICKSVPNDPGRNGFWSSCDNSRCDISITVGKLGGLGKVPSSVSVISYVQEANADIELRYRIVPGGQLIAVPGADPITNSRWDSLSFDLSQLTWTPASEIVLRLSSVAGSVDVLDKIDFTFEESPESTAEPSTEQTTLRTTEQPTTEQPTTEQATTEQQTTEQPTTEQLTTEQPTTESTSEPTTEPTTAQPTTETPTTKPPIDFDCPTPDGLHADPKNCRGFYNCDNFLPHHFCCPLPLFYNAFTEQCDFPDMVECNNDPALPCDSPPGMYGRRYRI